MKHVLVNLVILTLTFSNALSERISDVDARGFLSRANGERVPAIEQGADSTERPSRQNGLVLPDDRDDSGIQLR